MDKILANRLLDHKEDLLPYLLLRAKCAQEMTQKLIRTDLQGLVSDEDLQILETSQYVEIEGDNILLGDGDRWLIDPPEIKRRERKNYDWVPPMLEKIAKDLGYPVDWSNKKGKYLKLFTTLKKNYTEDQIEKANKFAQQNDPQCGLNKFLTQSFFKGYLYGKQEVKNRVDLEYRDEEHSNQMKELDEATRKWLEG